MAADEVISLCPNRGVSDLAAQQAFEVLHSLNNDKSEAAESERDMLRQALRDASGKSERALA